MAKKDSSDFEDLKDKVLNKMVNPYETLRKGFEIFSKKWLEQQKAGPLDKRDMDELIVESLDESIESEKKKQK
ncbi:MAG: hypothetical protein J7L54_02570 [Elusimicrobia bacterium]|nr:hypothetical protein [Elusimicrobiota bacterium]